MSAARTGTASRLNPEGTAAGGVLGTRTINEAQRDLLAEVGLASAAVFFCAGFGVAWMFGFGTVEAVVVGIALMFSSSTRRR